MNFFAYKSLVNSLSFGKRLPDAVYLHESHLESAPYELISFVTSVAAAHGGDFEWNILKLYRRDFKVTLLSYPDFDCESYPALRASLTIDLVRSNIRRTNFSHSSNPPILHRKETLVPSSYPLYNNFLEVTEEGEKAGLYQNSRRIGFMRSWERVIAQKGYALVNGRLVGRNRRAEAMAINEVTSVEIKRHLTAVDRDKLSTPMQSLARHGYLDGEYSILDYGCGKGHDLLELEAHGLNATGWDPAYRPDGIKKPSDIVNLGFVINVIEDRQERVEVLKGAYSLAKKFLVVSVMLGGEATIQSFTPYKDGVVTSRGTFQKYFSQSELRAFIESTLQVKAVPVGPGLHYIFKDEIAEQKFLVTRQRVRREWKQLNRRDHQSPSVDSQATFEKNLGLFREFWATCLDFGRPPANDEFDRSEEIRRIIGSHRKAFTSSIEYFGDEDYRTARAGRKKDLTVFLALSLFDRHRAYSSMPISLQRDIRSFFGKPLAAYDFAKEALFSIANTDMIGKACENAYKKLGCGRIEQGESFTFCANFLNILPPILRIYVGCATQLYGDIDSVHLIKIHITSGKVSLMIYDDFSKLLPILTDRIKIRMKDQHVDFFPYSKNVEQQPLYWKSKYLRRDCPECAVQMKFDKRLMSTGLDFSGYGPNLSELTSHLSRMRFRIPGSL